MKISIITVTYNSAHTLQRTLDSVKCQTYGNIEHILIDGASKDNTVEIIKKAGITHWISAPDQGMYDALNKGIQRATGDVIGILNSDDCLHDETILSKIVDAFHQSQDVAAVYGDIRFVSPKNPEKTIRYYSSAHFHPGKFARGYMPAHPSFYCRKELYEKYGYFQVDYKIAADYELLTRFLYKHKVKHKYLPLLMVDMLPGGLSNQTLRSRWILNKEIVRACRENGIHTTMWKVSMKYFRKIFEYVGKRAVNNSVST